MNTIFPFETDFTYSLLIQEHSFFFIIGIITFSISVILRTKKLFLTQLIIFFSIYAIEESLSNILYWVLIIVQVLLGIIIIYALKKAVHQNYLLILKKTHKVPRDITKCGNLGSQSSFFWLEQVSERRNVISHFFFSKQNSTFF